MEQKDISAGFIRRRRVCLICYYQQELAKKQ